MSVIRCPICESEVSWHDCKETYYSTYNGQEYRRFECPNCDLHWWEPLKIVPEFYEGEGCLAYRLFHRDLRMELPEWCKPFFKHFPKTEVRGKLLDVGCGDGLFLKYARDMGFEIWGIDIDKKSIEIAKRRLGDENLYPMSLEEFYEFAKLKNLKFDVITFFEVLEHQDRPREFLKIVKDLLKDDGYIAGSVPNRDSIFVRFFNKYSCSDNPPHHFLRFSEKALERALKLSGFLEVEIYRLDFSLAGLFLYIEKKIFGNLDDFKAKLISRIEREALTVEEVAKISPRKALYLQVLRAFRNFSLLPFVPFYIKKLKGNGISLYFQAKK